MESNPLTHVTRALWALVHTLGHGIPNYPVQQECPFCEGIDEEFKEEEG